MANIRPFINDHLLEPLKHYNTVIQDTMIEIIIQRLQELYDYTLKFPEIVTPNKSRLDILKAITEQFLFTIREDADIEEQIAILENILYMYSRRGSIDTIENMWKYYGGTLPKDVRVVIPSYNLFRYSISKLSGTHVFQDNTINRTGVYEIRLINNTYPIPDLREFLIKELVAAGNLIYFTNELYMDVLGDEDDANPYRYLVHEHTYLDIQMTVLKSHQGFTWSGPNPLSPNPRKDIYMYNSPTTPTNPPRYVDSTKELVDIFSARDIEKMTEYRDLNDSLYSGKPAIFLELTKIIDIDHILLNTYKTYQSLGFFLDIIRDAGEITYHTRIKKNYELLLHSYSYCTPTDSSMILYRYLYDSQGNLIESRYPGYFILGESLLGEELV